MVGVFAFPALLPRFIDEWQLDNTGAGWISGIYFAGYTLAVPVLVTLTDRRDARVIYLLGAALAAVSAGGFALLAEGFWSALLFRFLAGVALAGTYMPGLRVLVDRYTGSRQSRAVAFYTASFSLGTAASFFVTGELAARIGWSGAFAGAAAAAAAAVLLVGLGTTAQPPRRADDETRRAFDFLPVLRNRPAMGYVLGYSAHCWELFAMRSWLVAFLAFSLGLTGSGGWPEPTTVATLSGLIAMAASIAGQELAARQGPPRFIARTMLVSGLMACGFGFTAGLPYGLVVLVALGYTMAIQADSAALTAGVVAAAEADRRGATLAVHTLIGFGGAAIGPIVLGAVLDATGSGTNPQAWGWGFASVGIVALLGRQALRLSRDKD